MNPTDFGHQCINNQPCNHEGEKAMAESNQINWQRVKELDEKYYMHA
ncbi:MAG: hypothetical protein HYY20_03470, partial [Candidatus Tectomicrobia bacterium]|nr:hypothetical protein [Candidatus Tectomicrobia bacterium]